MVQFGTAIISFSLSDLSYQCLSGGTETFRGQPVSALPCIIQIEIIKVVIIVKNFIPLTSSRQGKSQGEFFHGSWFLGTLFLSQPLSL